MSEYCLFAMPYGLLLVARRFNIQDGFDNLDEFLFWHGAGSDLRLPFQRNEHEGGNGLDIECCADGAFLIHIDFVYVYFVFILCGELFHYGCDRLAWRAPVGVKIDDCRFVAEVFQLIAVGLEIENLFGKIFFREMYGGAFVVRLFLGLSVA